MRDSLPRFWTLWGLDSRGAWIFRILRSFLLLVSGFGSGSFRPLLDRVSRV
jgi:hypothetical protein